MRRLFPWILLVLGTTLVFGTSYLYAQDDDAEEPVYYGIDDCGDCHRNIARDHEVSLHALALIDASDEEAPILADFNEGEDLRTVNFGEGDPRPFEIEDVTFAMGTRYIQRYVYEVDDGEYRVFPAEWNVVDEMWHPYLPGEGDWLEDDAYDWGVNCAGCHTTGFNAEEVTWEEDGVSCEACHGPGGTHVDLADEYGNRPSESEIDEIRAAIVVGSDPQLCGQCHSQGRDPDGVHPFSVNYLPGDDLLAEEAFVLVPPDDEAHYWSTGHAHAQNMQFNEWLNSAHSRSLSTLRESDAAEDACLQCHSADYRSNQRLLALHEDGDREGNPPAPVTLETAQFGVTCSACHYPHADPEESEFFLTANPAYEQCLDCHQGTDVTPGIHHPVKEMFQGETVIESVEGVASVHFEAEQGPDCISCHMSRVPVNGFALASHALTIIEPAQAEEELSSPCSTCHVDLTATDMQFLIDDTQEVVRSRLSVAWARYASIETPDASDEERAAQLNQIVEALTFIQNDGSLGVHNYAYTDALLSFAERSLTELSVPGAVIEPTEGPAPTATPSEAGVTVVQTGSEPVPAGFRPITWIIIGAALLTLLLAAMSFFRRPTEEETRA